MKIIINLYFFYHNFKKVFNAFLSLLCNLDLAIELEVCMNLFFIFG